MGLSVIKSLIAKTKIVFKRSLVLLAILIHTILVENKRKQFNAQQFQQIT